MGRITRTLLVAALAALALAPAAKAELVGEFDASMKNFKISYGGYTTVLDGRVYDTTGAQPPQLTNAQIHFPRGSQFRQLYLSGKYLCNWVALEVMLNADQCRYSQFASGTMLIDARPTFPDPVTTTVNLFIGPPSVDDIAKGGTGRVGVLVGRTAAFPAQVLYGNMYRDSAPYGYRLVLPTAIVPGNPGTKLSVAELHLISPGITIKRRSHGKTRKLFWTTLPKCSRTKQLSFAADYQFVNAPQITRARTVRCSKFLQNPSAKGNGGI